MKIRWLKYTGLALISVLIFSLSMFITTFVLNNNFFSLCTGEQCSANPISIGTTDLKDLPNELKSYIIDSNLRSTLPKAYIVQSGSMEPAILTGSLVISLPQDSYVQNDVITFRPENSKNLITHRIYSKTYPRGIEYEPEYLTAGDANEDFDNWEVKEENIVGKVVLNIPYLGYIADKAKTPYGFILLVIVPATIVIYEELKSILKELGSGVKELLSRLYQRLKKIISKGNYKDNSRTILKTPPVFPNSENNKIQGSFNILKRTSVLLPVFGAFLVFAELASSFFFDAETSKGNVFSATDWSPEIANTLVIHEVLPLSNCDLGNSFAQWVEIYNGYDIPVNLQDFSLQDNNGDTVTLVNAGNITLQPGEFALLSHDSSIWNKCYSDNGVITTNLGSGNLDLNTGVLRLLDSNDAIIDRVQWSGFGPPEPGINQSIERVSLGQDSEIGDGWEASDFDIQCPPTPGFWQPTTSGCKIVINEINWAGNNVDSDDEWIELRNLSGEDINLDGWFLEGARTGNSVLDLPANNIPANGFYLISNYDENTSKISIPPNLISSSLQLDNQNAQIILKDSHGNIIDTADDGDDDPLAGSNTAPKRSMERVENPGDGTLASDWEDADSHTNMDGNTDNDEFGTPGAANTSP